jgi:predicted O-linked N-acetylglucosamine transferase (SPINDLY family)
LLGQFFSADSVCNSGEIERDASRLIDEGNEFEEAGRFDAAMQCYETAVRLSPDLARAHLNRGNILVMTGNVAEGLGTYATALSLDPAYVAAHFNIGNAYANLGRNEEALAAYKKAIELKPDFADAEVALGNVFEEMGLFDLAIEHYRRALLIKPDYAEVHLNLGNALKALGCLSDALASCRRALEINPNFAEALICLGSILHGLKRREEAVESYRRAVAIRPDLAEAHNTLGTLLKELGQFDDAIASYRRALEIAPDSAATHNRLGYALKDLARFDEAVVCFGNALKINPNLVAAHNNLGHAFQVLGKFEAAIASYRRALEIDPGFVEARSNLGNVFKDLGQLDAALDCYRQALEIKPDFPEVLSNLGSALHDSGRFDEAVESFSRALQIDPDLAMTHNNLGVAFKELGLLDEAVASISRALAIDPDFVDAHRNRLFVRNYLADQPAPLLLSEAQVYGDVVMRKARPYLHWNNLPVRDRRLCVGLVSGDLCNHPVGYFLESVLSALVGRDKNRVEFVAYSSHVSVDVVSERIKACCRTWHSVVGLSDAQLARQIRDDGVDVLIDLSGHTAYSRLPMFAWKPAPVQVSWLGYFATTGVAAMDYFIADPWTLPDREEQFFTEKIWYLPETRLCFTPPDLDVPVSLLPALNNQYVTFACFNHLTKMGDEVVATWARILTAVPNSRLFLRAKQMSENSVRERIVERFLAHGVGATQLMLEGPVSRTDYLAAYQEVDMVLDPFPYPGGTTTVEALWMGVPVLTLAGERFLSRQGVGFLMNAGLPEWIAVDIDDYVARAVLHASDLQSLALLRKDLRKSVLASPIFDAPRFARHFESALRGMWKKWCDQQTEATACSPTTR